MSFDRLMNKQTVIYLYHEIILCNQKEESIYFCLCWVFVALHRFSLVGSGGSSTCGAQASHCHGFSCGAQALAACELQ